jgi:hypothetical protein
MDKYYLVFERATERSFVNSLENKLDRESFFQAWDSVIQAKSSVAAGLDTLHKHNVLHRYAPYMLTLHYFSSYRAADSWTSTTRTSWWPFGNTTMTPSIFKIRLYAL